MRSSRSLSAATDASSSARRRNERLVQRGPLIGCRQHGADLVQSAAEVAQLDDAQQRPELASA